MIPLWRNHFDLESSLSWAIFQYNVDAFEFKHCNPPLSPHKLFNLLVTGAHSARHPYPSLSR